MKNFIKKIERFFMAIPFATIQEHTTAAEIAGVAPLKEVSLRQIFQSIETTFAAAAFACSNCPDTAIEIMDAAPSFKPNTSARINGTSLAKTFMAKQPAA